MAPISLTRPFRLIGELMNNSFARARRAWEARSVAGYQELLRLQAGLGADYATLYLGGTSSLQVAPAEMKAFLPDLVPALQAAAALPISFDNPDVAFHREALKHYDRARGPAPILNSVAASRTGLDEMVELAARYDTLVFVMASERPLPGGGGAPCRTAADIHTAAKHFVEMLVVRSGRTNDQIIIDPGLAPLASDLTGGVAMGLEAMRLIRADRDLAGVHLSVGLTNVSQGTPREVRTAIEKAYLTVAVAAGLDFVLGNPEKGLELVAEADPVLAGVREALRVGRAGPGESAEDAGMRQVEAIMELYR